MSGFLGILAAGGINYALDKQPASAFDLEISPSNAFASISFAADGSVTETNAAGFQLVTFGNVADLQVLVSGTGDTPSGSALDTWLAFGAAGFSLSQSGVGTKAFSGTYSVRVASTGYVLGGSTFSLDAIVDI